MHEAEDITLSQLQGCDLDELEALYAEERPLLMPAGCFRGVHLAWLNTAGAHHSLIRPLQHLGFRLLPFGVDFAAQRWFFFRRELGVGRFVARPGRSWWRETDTIRLQYDVSRLPSFVRNLLYDEVKPLSASLCLGIGGINAPRGRGDHFFFALVAGE